MPDEAQRPNEGQLAWRTQTLERRLEEVLADIASLEKEMRDRSHSVQASVEGLRLICNLIPEHGRRLEAIERHDVAVIANRVATLEQQMGSFRRDVSEQFKLVQDKFDGQNRLLWGIAIALISAAVTIGIAIATNTFG